MFEKNVNLQNKCPRFIDIMTKKYDNIDKLCHEALVVVSAFLRDRPFSIKIIERRKHK